MKGFTLLEILLVILIIVFLVALIFPLGLDFYKSQQLQAHSQQILQTLRKAQLKAMAVEGGSSFGVHFDNTNKKYVLFKGDFYEPANPDPSDEEFNFPSVITVSGLLEVVFSRYEGKPIPLGNIIINGDDLTYTININEIGRINLEL